MTAVVDYVREQRHHHVHALQIHVLVFSAQTVVVGRVRELKFQIAHVLQIVAEARNAMMVVEETAMVQRIVVQELHAMINVRETPEIIMGNVWMVDAAILLRYAVAVV